MKGERTHNRDEQVQRCQTMAKPFLLSPWKHFLYGHSSGVQEQFNSVRQMLSPLTMSPPCTRREKGFYQPCFLSAALWKPRTQNQFLKHQTLIHRFHKHNGSADYLGKVKPVLAEMKATCESDSPSARPSCWTKGIPFLLDLYNPPEATSGRC